MKDIVRIGVLGAGRIGKLHGDNLANSVPGAKVEGVAEIYLNDEIKAWAEGLGASIITKDPDEVINSDKIDAVFICSSTDTHADFIIKAARAGKHIFCEKPIATDVEVIKNALAEVEKAGVKMQVGFVRRFDHNHKKVRDTVASGKLGKPHIVKVTSRDPEPPPVEYVKVSGGIFMDMMIHDFDMVRYLSGSEVTEISTYGSIMISPEIEQYGDVDTAICMLKFENGAIGVIENSRAARYGYDQRTEVHCDKGCVRAENDLDNMAAIYTGEGVENAKPTWFFLERYNDAFIAECNDFVAAIREDKDVPVSGKDGLMPVYIAQAAGLSLKEGRPVKLSEVM